MPIPQNGQTHSNNSLVNCKLKLALKELKGQVEVDVRSGYISNGKDPKYVPKLPVFVGGHTDFMIGVKYLRYYPEKVFQLPFGLTIYKFQFENADGTKDVIGGPHRVFTEIKSSYQVNVRSFMSDQCKLF